MSGAWSRDDYLSLVQDEKIPALAYVISKFETVMEEIGRIEGWSEEGSGG